jgi:hypothetical protein
VKLLTSLQHLCGSLPDVRQDIGHRNRRKASLFAALSRRQAPRWNFHKY